MLNHSIHSKDWLLIANSTPLADNKLLDLARDKRILVLDGAYEPINALRLPIDVLLGDFDSIDSKTLLQVQNTNTIIVHTPDQNQTDLEKGIIYLDQMFAKSILICCATGKRLDHTLYNLRLLKKFHQVLRPLLLHTDTETIHYLRNTTLNISGKINDGIALLGFPTACITTTGLKYDVTHFNLQFEQQASISNSLIADNACINVSGEALLIHSNHQQ